MRLLAANAGDPTKIQDGTVHRVTPDNWEERSRNCKHWTLLSPLDAFYARNQRTFMYIYPHRLDKGLITSSLSRILVKFPQIGGRLISLSGVLLIDHSKPCIDVFVRECPHNELDYEWETKYLRQLCPSVPVSCPYILNTPLARVQITYLPGGRTALSLSISHAVADAHSVFILLNAWAAESRGQKYAEPDHDRSKIAIHSSRDLKRQGGGRAHLGFKRQAFVLQAYPLVRSRDLRVLVTRHFEFTPCDILRFKQKAVLEGRASHKLQGRIVSSNDVLAAHFFRILALVDAPDTLPSAVYDLVAVIDLRNRLSGVKDAYFGNAMSHVYFSMTRRQLLHSDLSELVHRTRRMLENCTESSVIDTLRFLQQVHDEEGGAAALVNLTPPIGERTMYIRNWTRLDVHGVNFGGLGPPSRFFFFPPRDNFHFVIPKPGGIVEWVLTVSAEKAERLDQLDVRNLDW